MDDSLTQTPRAPPPAPRGKQVLEESGGESEVNWPSIPSSSDEAGQPAATQVVVPVDNEEEEEDETPLIVSRTRAHAAVATTSATAVGSVATTTPAVAATAVATPLTVHATPWAAATPRAPTALPARRLFRGFKLQLNPPKDGSPASAGKRGRADSPPAVPSKKARTQAGSSSDPAATRASGAAAAPAADAAPKEVALAMGPIAPAPGAGAAVIDLGPVIEAAGTAEEPEAKAKKEHAEVLAAAQVRIDEKSDLISSYLGQIQGLRVKLEGQTKATEDAVTAAARQEVELNSAEDRRARLETELATVWEELVKTGEENAAKATQLSAQASLLRKAKHAMHLARTNHGTLIGQRELETKKLLGIAQPLRNLLPRFELRATRVDGRTLPR
ncbi:uncharacterized protein LOC104583306 [Brachypodium distachyon]|uniref:uncharacterized protein LOC104583306 n=1 Tax=Brachypodium distachyon TaxID=15368 RepID=UPI00052FEC9F|nr:uncharacterized protein LOC104583306 [Brachypodium distachyon]|eukprot:XP_010233468.1 uncharacterized protein LOC104583306 [Brachypodium distachyon]